MNVHVSERIPWRDGRAGGRGTAQDEEGGGLPAGVDVWPTYVTPALLSRRALSIALFTCLTPLLCAAPHSVL